MDSEARCPAVLVGVEKADTFGRQEDCVQSIRARGGDPHQGAILSEGQGRENGVRGPPRLRRECLPAAHRCAMRAVGGKRRKRRKRRQMGTARSQKQ